MQVIYEWDNFITEVGQPTSSIWDKRSIKLVGIVGAPTYGLYLFNTNRGG